MLLILYILDSVPQPVFQVDQHLIFQTCLRGELTETFYYPSIIKSFHVSAFYSHNPILRSQRFLL